jgi:hypothetical protein
MSLTQFEHLATLTDPVPAQSTLDRMEDLFIKWRREIITAKNKRMQADVFERRHTDPEAQASDYFGLLSSQLTQAEIQRKRVELEIIEVARLIVAEADAETLEETI